MIRNPPPSPHIYRPTTSIGCGAAAKGTRATQCAVKVHLWAAVAPPAVLSLFLCVCVYLGSHAQISSMSGFGSAVRAERARAIDVHINGKSARCAQRDLLLLTTRRAAKGIWDISPHYLCVCVFVRDARCAACAIRFQ